MAAELIYKFNRERTKLLMSNTFAFGKRVLAVATAVATIAWAVGIAAFAVPQTAHAASAGDLIKGTSLSAVYYYGYDGLRYTFPNLKTYNTWYSDFSGVSTLSDSAIAAISLGGNVVYRPGSRWVKIQSDTKTYAVSTSGSIHWIETEAVATGFAGSDWNTVIDDVPDVFFVDYSVAASLMSATAFDGMMYMDGADYVLSWAGEKRVVSAAGRTANRMQDRFFLDGAGIDDSALTAGAQITSNICNVTDAAQTGCSTVVTTGAVAVSLSSSTPAGATLPLGANSVEVLSFNLKAGSEAAQVDGLAVKMVGVGATTNVTNVYLYEGANRLTEARSVNASTRMSTFNNLNLALAAGETRTITVRVETYTSGSQGDQIQFAVAAATDVTTAGSVSGSFPVTGNAFTLATVSAGGITIEKNGTMINPNIGTADHKIAQFRLTASTEDASVKEVTLKIDNAPDHGDFKLYYNTTLLTTGTFLGNKLVRFDLSASPLAIAEGANKILYVTADVTGDAGEDITVSLDRDTDLVAIGGDYGFGLAVTRTSYDESGTNCASAADDCSWSELEGGDITFAFNGPAAGDVPTNSQDVSLFEFSLTSLGEITVKDLDIILYGDDAATLDGNAFDADGQTGNDDDDEGLINGNDDGDVADSGDEASLKDIKIVNIDTGAVIMGPLELDNLTADDTQTIDFTDDFSMDAGETLNLRVTADVDNGVATGTAFGATLDISGFVAEDVNGTTIATSSIVPSSDLVGFNQVARTSTLTVQLASSPTSTTVVQGTNGVEFLGMVFTAGDASDITVTSLTMTAYGDDTNTTAMDFGGASGFEVEDYLSSCSLYDDADALLDGPKSVSTVGAIVFDTINWTIPAGAGKTAVAKCNVANPSDTDDDVLALDIALDTDITAQDEDSNSPTITTTPAVASSQGVNDTDGDTTTATGNFDASVGITVTENGSLAESAGSSTPSSDFVLTSSTDVHIATYTFLATNESFEIQTLTFSEEAGEDGTNGATAGTAVTTNSNETTYTNNISKVKIEYPKADGSTGTTSVSMSGNEAKFSGLNLFVDEASTASVKVYVSTPATDRTSGGYATSNERLRLGLFIDATNLDNFKAVGLSSGTTLNETTGSIAAIGDDLADGIGTFVVRETKPTVTASASTPSGTGFVPGDREVFRFNVAANTNEDVVVEEIIFKVASTDNAASDWNFCDTNDSGTGDIDEPDFDLYNLSTTGTTTAVDVDADWSILTTDATVCTDSTDEAAYAHLDLTTPQVVPAGTTYTYALYFDSTGASSANDDSIQFSIPADPIVSVFLDNTDTYASAGTTDTVLTVGTGGNYTAGDIICLDESAGTACTASEERALVVSISSNDLTVVRGYLGTYPTTDVAGAPHRLPSSLFWRDDGLTSTATYPGQVYWGSYLVDNLPISGGAMGF